jgi:ribosome-associated protein
MVGVRYARQDIEKPRTLSQMDHEQVDVVCFAHPCVWLGRSNAHAAHCDVGFRGELKNRHRLTPVCRRQTRIASSIGLYLCLSADEVPSNEPLIVDLSDKVVEKTKKVRTRTRNLIGEIGKTVDVVDQRTAAALPPVEEDELAEYARTAVRAADQRKAVDPVVIRIANVSYITTFMVCVTGNNSPQIRAIGNLVEEDLYKKHNLKPKRSTGTANSGWLLLDYGDMMVHIFSPEQRDNYDLESLWSQGEGLDISDCLITVGNKWPVRWRDDTNDVGNGNASTPNSSTDGDTDEDDWLA